MEKYHVSILAKEIVKRAPKAGIVVDGTLGGGGHSRLLFNNLEKGKVISIDKDMDAIDHVVSTDQLVEKISIGNHRIFGKSELEKDWIVVQGVFSDTLEVLNNTVADKADFFLVDLGVSSYQIDNRLRGFSFMEKGPLDMRMDKTQSLKAADLVNGLNKKELERIFEEYGEEKYAAIIAQAIVQARSKKQIKNTVDIVEIIIKSVGDRYESSKHPARRVFQALRIVVNNELGELERLCHDLTHIVRKDGRVVILTFHSLERKVVEKYFNNFELIEPTEEEIRSNSRAKSCVGYVITI